MREVPTYGTLQGISHRVSLAAVFAIKATRPQNDGSCRHKQTSHQRVGHLEVRQQLC